MESIIDELSREPAEMKVYNLITEAVSCPKPVSDTSDGMMNPGVRIKSYILALL
jgi:hypothetical protein